MSILVSFAGSGNLAWHLAPALENAGYPVREVFSRNPAQAGKLVERLYEAEVKATLDFSTSPAQLFILAVPDETIEEVAREIILPDDAILVHTSGSQPLSKLGYAATPNIGVLYPLQVFRKDRKINFSDVPLFIESELAVVEQHLMTMGRAISKQVHTVDAQQRKALQVASVFASGFTGYMIKLSKALAEQNRLNGDWLNALIAESVNQALAGGTDRGTMSPAHRDDFETLDKHMEFLQSDARLAELYRVVSQHIIDAH